jgi:hypothetical protein
MLEMMLRRHSRIAKLLLIVVVAAGCGWWLYMRCTSVVSLPSRSALIGQLVVKVPQGTAISRAREVMQRSGFDCSLRTNASFLEYDYGRFLAQHSGLDYLYCSRRRLLRRDQVGIVHTNGLVTGYVVSVTQSVP